MSHMFELNRRHLLQGVAAVGGSLLLPASVAKAAAAQKKGGTFRLGMGHGSTTDNYDPATWANAFIQVVTTGMHGFLTEVDMNGKLVGSVAESWEASADGLTWTFKLRQGITFHSGKTLDADDVIASINYHRGADSKSAAKPVVEGITDIKADGKNVVKFMLKDRDADFAFKLSDYHLAILVGKDGKIDNKSSDGVGAYKMKSYDPGVSAKLVRNENYWKKDKAFFDAVEVLPILDAAARTNALLSGAVDAIDRVDLKTINLLKKRSDVSILSVTGTQHYTFPMDTRAAPFKDNNVRQALKYAFDRNEMVEKVLQGYGMAGNDHPISPSMRFYNKDLAQHGYDPDKVKFYLGKAGLTKLDVSLSVADAAFSGAVDAGVLFAEKAAKTGITLNVVKEPNDGYWDNVWMKKPFAACYWGGRPTEDWMFATAYSSGAAWNDAFWEHEKFNKLLVAARSEQNEDNRRTMYYEMQDIVSNEGGEIVPMFANYVMATSKKIATPEKVAANWTMDGLRVLERWSFA